LLVESISTLLNGITTVELVIPVKYSYPELRQTGSSNNLLSIDTPVVVMSFPLPERSFQTKFVVIPS